MRTVALISCSSKKQKAKAKAKDLYISKSFKLNMSLSNRTHPAQKYILSAKHGLLKMDDVIAPYDLCLNDMDTNEITIWSNRVYENLCKCENVSSTRFIFFADEIYSKFLMPKLKHSCVYVQQLK